MQSGSDRYCDGVFARAEKKEMAAEDRDRKLEEYLKQPKRGLPQDDTP
jgi:hypothetical protein